MELSKVIKELSNFVSGERLDSAIKWVLTFCPENIEQAIPSIELAADGPFLRSLFLVTGSYLVEIHLDQPGDPFDLIGLQTVRNYRVYLVDQVIKTNDQKEVRYETAKIQLLHIGTDRFTTHLSYVGPDRDHWLKKVCQALPVKRLLASTTRWSGPAGKQLVMLARRWPPAVQRHA